MKQLIEFFNQGGVVMLMIAGISVVAWLLALRSRHIAGLLLRDLAFIRKTFLTPDRTCSGAVPSKNAQQRSRAFFETRLARLEGSTTFLASFAAALPLLGLLGTVLGMLVTFGAIQQYGTGRPALLAGGIRQALLTTQAGLLAALPVLFFHHMISSKCRKIDSELNIVFHELESVSKPDSHKK